MKLDVPQPPTQKLLLSRQISSLYKVQAIIADRNPVVVAFPTPKV